MGALDEFSPAKAGAAGVVLSALNPKNLLLAVAGAAAIAQTGISTGQQVGSYVVFVAIASIGVAARRDLFRNGRTIPAPPGRAQDLARPQQRRDHGRPDADHLGGRIRNSARRNNLA